MRASELKKGMLVSTVHGELTVDSSTAGPNGLQRLVVGDKVCVCRPNTDFQLVRAPGTLFARQENENVQLYADAHCTEKVAAFPNDDSNRPKRTDKSATVNYAQYRMVWV